MTKMQGTVEVLFLLGLLTTGIFTQATQLTVNSNTAMPMTNFYSGNGTMGLTIVNGIFGFSQQDPTTGQTVPMYPDLTFSSVYIPTGASTSFQCTAAMGCSTSGTDTCIMYNAPGPKSPVNCIKAATTMRFSNLPSQDASKAATLSFDLITSEGTSGWGLYNSNNGVWGLAPNSPFWGFFSQAYKGDSKSVSIMYKIDDEDIEVQSTPSLMKFDSSSQVTVNGRTTNTKQVSSSFSANSGSNSQVWIWNSSRISPYAGDDKDNVPLCIDNTVDAFFILNQVDYDDTVKVLSNQLCGKDSECIRSSSTFQNVDNIKVSLKSDDGNQDITITIGAKDFISYMGDENNSNALANLGIAPMKNSAACFPYSNETAIVPSNPVAFGLGRLFLSKAELQITQISTQKFTLSFSQIPRKTNMLYPILMIISGAIVLVAITLIVIFNLPKKEPAADDGYKTA